MILGSFGMPRGVPHWGYMDGETVSYTLLPEMRPVVVRGAGQSYGDAAISTHGTVLSTANLNKLVAFYPHKQRIEVEAGMSLRSLLAITLPCGLMPVALPGTGNVTVGGAIAADIHGKNHHRAGSFGNGVLSFTLMRDDGPALVFPKSDLFRATVGGLGLTGFIRSATLRLVPASSHIDLTVAPFSTLAEWAALNAEFERTHEHVVAWIDPFKPVAQGLILAGNPAGHDEAFEVGQGGWLGVPPIPFRAVNSVSARAVNSLYRARTRSGQRTLPQYLWPLDAVKGWNRAYGPNGIAQYQFVTPMAAGVAPVEEALALVKRSGLTSFLTVLKTFGSIPPSGMLSFPMEGFTLALDFPASAAVFEVLNDLDRIVLAAGGRLYPVKDRRMSPETFAAGYRELPAFRRFVSRSFQSDFWRRMTIPDYAGATPSPAHTPIKSTT